MPCRWRRTRQRAKPWQSTSSWWLLCFSHGSQQALPAINPGLLAPAHNNKTTTTPATLDLLQSKSEPRREIDAIFWWWWWCWCWCWCCCWKFKPEVSAGSADLAGIHSKIKAEEECRKQVANAMFFYSLVVRADVCKKSCKPVSENLLWTITLPCKKGVTALKPSVYLIFLFVGRWSLIEIFILLCCCWLLDVGRTHYPCCVWQYIAIYFRL